MSPLPRKVVLPEGWFEVVGGKAEEEGGSSMPIGLTHERPRGTLPEGWACIPGSGVTVPEIKKNHGYGSYPALKTLQSRASRIKVIEAFQRWEPLVESALGDAGKFCDFRNGIGWEERFKQQKAALRSAIRQIEAETPGLAIKRRSPRRKTRRSSPQKPKNPKPS